MRIGPTRNPIPALGGDVEFSLPFGHRTQRICGSTKVSSEISGGTGEPAMIRFCLTLQPLGEQPIFGRGYAPPGVVVFWANPPTGA